MAAYRERPAAYVELLFNQKATNWNSRTFPSRTQRKPKARRGIYSPMKIIIKFSVSDTNPNGTFEPPPTQAHFSSRLSM